MKVQTCSVLFLIVSTLRSVLVNGQTSPLTCKKCDRAASLDTCSSSVKCGDDEICFMEELITDELTVVYNGGCRSKVVCTSGVGGSPSIGKRDVQKRADLVACSRCCDIKKKSGELDCNARLCGIKYTNTNSTRCYQCDSGATNAEQGDVDVPVDCLSETTCQPNEACGAERLDVSGTDSHKYTCLPKRVCTLLTKEALKRKDECLTNPDPRICGNIGSGKRASTQLCTACCGDGLCNSGSCEQVIDRLFNLWKGGALNFDTLQQKGTPKPVSTAPPPTTAPTSPSTIPTQPPTKPPTKPPTQPPTAPPTQPPTKPPTQPPTTPSTAVPTAPPTKPPTAPPTAAPTAPPTQPPSTAAPTAPPTQPPSTAAPTAPPTQPPSTVAPTAPPTQPPSTVAPTAPPTKPLTTVAASTPPKTPAVASVVVSQAASSSIPPVSTAKTSSNTTGIVG